MEKKGKYIVFEGLPKCGKSTQAGLLYAELTGRFPDRRVILTKEPGGSEIADAIRKLVQGTPFKEQMTPVCEAYLYAASRAQTLRTIVRPVVESGGIALSDRSFLSSKAIQGGARVECDGSDKFEAMDLDFFKAIRAGYDSFSLAMETIPGDQSVETIHGLIMVSVLKLLHDTPEN